MTNKAIEANGGKPLPLYQKALCGLTAGAIGASVGSPADLALIRMQADATLPAAQRRHYKNAFHALYRIVGDEGVLALWKGAGPTVVRAMALNMGMLASYDQSSEFFRDSLGFGETSTVVGEILWRKFRYWFLLKSLMLLFGVCFTAEYSMVEILIYNCTVGYLLNNTSSFGGKYMIW